MWRVDNHRKSLRYFQIPDFNFAENNTKNRRIHIVFSILHDKLNYTRGLIQLIQLPCIISMNVSMFDCHVSIIKSFTDLLTYLILQYKMPHRVVTLADFQ